MADAVFRSDKAKRLGTALTVTAYRNLYQSPVLDRIGLITAGVKAIDAKAWLDVPIIGTILLLRALESV